MPTSQDYAAFTEIPEVTQLHLVSCSYSSWYHKYKQHLLTKAEIIKPLPRTFIEYLTSDGIKLPMEDQLQFDADGFSDYSDWEEDLEDTSVVNNKLEELDPVLLFLDLHTEIQDKVKTLKGGFTPKLNWSAPKDATWILPNNTMKCNDVKDLYLLLNASNYVMHDLTELFTDDKFPRPSDFQYELVLRKWHEDLNTAMEFRCFVKNRTLIAITQRDLNYYTYLEELQDQIYDAITSFFERYLQTTFDTDNFIFDVYVPRPFQKTYLIDINPYSRVTDSLLFTWNELLLIDERAPDFEPELRLVDEVNVGRFASKEHSENQVPRDIVDATMDSNAMAELAREWRKMMDKEDETEDE